MRDELLKRLRADIGKSAPLAAALSELEPVVARQYQSEPPCC
jgi:hypothetical protein